MAMAAWYIETWVKAPLAVTSPTAQTPSVTRMWSSTGMARASSSTPMDPTLRACRLGRRPAATNNWSATSGSPDSKPMVKR